MTRRTGRIRVVTAMRPGTNDRSEGVWSGPRLDAAVLHVGEGHPGEEQHVEPEVWTEQRVDDGEHGRGHGDEEEAAGVAAARGHIHGSATCAGRGPYVRLVPQPRLESLPAPRYIAIVPVHPPDAQPFDHVSLPRLII